MEQAGRYLESWFAAHDYKLNGWGVTILDGRYHFLTELLGPTHFNMQQRASLESALEAELGVPVHLFVRTQLESVIGPQGYIGFSELLENYRALNREAYGSAIDQSIINSR